MLNRHCIQQQHWQVKLLGSEAQGFALQNRLTALNRDWLQAAMQQLFDELADETQWLYIEQLHLDLGTVNLQALDQQLMPRLLQQLREALLNQRASNMTASQQHAHATETEHLPQEPQLRLFRAFCHFLGTGLLPWWFSLPPGQTLEQLWLQHLQQRMLTEAQRHTVRQLLLKPLVFVRHSQQFGVPSKLALLGQVHAELADAVNALIHLHFGSVNQPSEQRATANAPISSIDELINHAYLLWLEQPLPNTRRDWQARLWATQDKAEQHLASNGSQSEPSIRRPANKENTEKQAVAKHLQTCTDASANQIPHAADSIQPHTEPEQPKPATTADGEHPQPISSVNADRSVVAKTMHTASSDSLTVDHQQGIYLDNAGLVLLHPFLPQLFNAIGVTEHQHIINVERGLQMLHFLCTGQTTAPEYQLPLAKVFLNWPLEQPVATLQALSSTDQEEGMALLNAVIRHWQALGNTSVDGLRGTFLLRPGKLIRREDDVWRLQVENQGFDILLNQLPWGFSMVKLPWMTKMLWVEWSY